MELEEFLSKLDGVKQIPSGFSARCPVPAHDDHVSSLSVNAGREGGVVVTCHGPCKTEDVVAAMGLSMADLAGTPHMVAEYPYVNEDGQVLYVKERWVPKDFRIRPGLPPPAQRVLFRADALRWARGNNATVWFTEGEKDALRLAEDFGYVATCEVTGAGPGKFLPHYADQVDGCHVVVVADNDAAGRAYAREVAKACARTALSVATVVPRFGKDISDLFDLGWGLEHLDPLPEAEQIGIVSAANLRDVKHEWAWPGYIPFGSVTLVEGDPGDGKSLVTTDLAARWSSGAPMPDDTPHDGPYGVLMVNAEDDPNATIKPRLRLAGANLHRVDLVAYGTEPDRPVTFSRDLPAISAYVIEHGIKIIVFDPLMSFIDDQVDTHNDHATRRALFPLYRLAQDTGAAVLVVRHLNKGTGGKAVYRGGGSIGVIGASRAAYAVGRDPDNLERRVWACVKMNIAERPASLALSIGKTDLGPVIEWHGEIDADVQRVLDGIVHGEDAEIMHFLNTVVQNGEPMKWSDIVKVGKDEGYTEAVLRKRRPKSRLVKIHGQGGNRDTRWGYLHHTLAHLPVEEPTFPSFPVSPTDPSGKADVSSPLARPPACLGTREIGESGDLAEQTGIETAETDEERDAHLEAADPICSVCGQVEGVLKYGDPYWVVRCIAHNPEDYGGGK